MEITRNSIIGDVLDKYPETAEAFLHQEAKQSKRLVWFMVQMPMSLLMFSIRLQTNNLSVFHIRAERID